MCSDHYLYVSLLYRTATEPRILRIISLKYVHTTASDRHESFFSRTATTCTCVSHRRPSTESFPRFYDNCSSFSPTATNSGHTNMSFGSSSAPDDTRRSPGSSRECGCINDLSGLFFFEPQDIFNTAHLFVLTRSCLSD